MAKVFVVNKSSHDFSLVESYGEIIYLSEGPLNRYATNHMHRLFTVAMADSEAHDYIVPCSLNVMNSIACAIFAYKHQKLNLLLYCQGNYLERNLVL